MEEDTCIFILGYTRENIDEKRKWNLERKEQKLRDKERDIERERERERYLQVSEWNVMRIINNQ